jgi:arsenical pump membrane protein
MEVGPTPVASAGGHGAGVPEGLGLALALAILALTLGAAVAGARLASEAVVAVAGALALLALGAIGLARAGDALNSLAPTVGFLAALLVIADGARREGLFAAIGASMAIRSGGAPARLLGIVVLVATAVTALLGLDATAVLLTPIVLATAARMRTDPRPHAYATGHLANSASLLLPIANLTNLLAFHAAGLSFSHFAALMALPTLGVVALEWAVLRRFFASVLKTAPERGGEEAAVAAPPLPRGAVVVLALTMAGFALSSLAGVAAVWVAAAGAAAFAARGLCRREASVASLVAAAEPGFLLFVLGLGVIVATAAHDGLGSAVASLLPNGSSLPALLAVAALSAALANVVNNLPATLILIPAAAAAGGQAALLAMLVGVNVGPNLTYVGSLATLLWRRVLRACGEDVALGEFTLLGLLTVPAALIVATVLLWVSLRV